MRSKVSLERNGVCDAKDGAACLVAMCGMLACVPARADYVPPFKGNDTGGIIAYSLAGQSDARQLAVDHCAATARW